MEEVRRSERIAKLSGLKNKYNQAARGGRVRRELAVAAAVPSMGVGGHDVSPSSSSSRSIRRSERIAKLSGELSRLKEQYHQAARGGRVRRELAVAAAVPSMGVGEHDVSPSSSSSRSIRRYPLRSTTSSSTSTTAVVDQNDCPNAAAAISTSSTSSLSDPKHRGSKTSSPSATGESSGQRRYAFRPRSNNNSAQGRVDATPNPLSPYTQRVLRVWGNRNKSADKFRKVKELIENQIEIKSGTVITLETDEGPIEFDVGRWVSYQRHYYHARNLSLLSHDRIQMLREIRFNFGEGSLEQRWMNRLNELTDFKEVYQHCNVPRYWHENPQLGTWVMEQRKLYNAGTLTPDRIRKLNELGFSWERFKDQWDDRYNELVEFKLKYGHTNVSCYGPQKQLGAWVSTQRQNMVRGESRLTEERIDKLNRIGFDWSPLQGLWDMRYQELLEFKKANGHTIVPRRRNGASQLSMWVHTQRVKKDWLIEHYPDRVALLDEIGFTWHVPIHVWNRRYSELKSFYDKYHHTRVSTEDLRLCNWCVHQRDLAVRGTLEFGKRRLLEAINFDFYKRGVSQKYVRIEWKFMHELMAALDEIGVDSDNLILDKCYGRCKKRPDGVITINERVEIFVEVDEEAHDPNQGSGTYELPNDENRMVELYNAAMSKDKVDVEIESVVFIRINTGMLRHVYSPQIETVISVFGRVMSDAPAAGGCHVYYIDYDEDDAHVQEAQEEKYRFEVRTIHTTGFNPTAYKIEERGDKSTT